ncbi:MAG: site-2 protease family protein [Geitlerinemataceae cyanobacterium]
MTVILLFILGLITYTILVRRVATVTRTPVWVLWLVMMTPAILMTAWGLVFGMQTPVPPTLAIGAFGLCFSLYWWLVAIGRIAPSEKDSPERDALAAGRESSSKSPDATANMTSDGGESSARSEVQSEARAETQSETQSAGDKPRPPLRPIDADEERQLRDCFSWSVYALQHLEYRPQAVICRGNLRTNPERAYSTVRKNIESHFGDRFLVVFQEDRQDRPFFMLAPNPNATDNPHPLAVATAAKRADRPDERPWVAVGLLFACLFTTTLAGVGFMRFNTGQYPENPVELLDGLPYAVSLLAILATHEFGHFFAAKHHNLRASLPYFIPVPFFLGTVGAFVRLRSPMPDRKVLFDVSIAGPLAGFMMALPLFVWGAAHSSVVEQTESSSLLNFTELQPQFSFLMTAVFRFVLPEGLDPTQAIALHPVAIAGYLGLILTAFNLMPIGTLDGGHIVHAMLGRKIARRIAQVARFVMVALTLLHQELLLWTLLLFLMPSQDEPALNDITELDDRRDAMGLVCLVLLATILLPAPKLLWAGLNF